MTDARLTAVSPYFPSVHHSRKLGVRKNSKTEEINRSRVGEHVHLNNGGSAAKALIVKDGCVLEERHNETIYYILIRFRKQEQ